MTSRCTVWAKMNFLYLWKVIILQTHLHIRYRNYIPRRFAGSQWYQLFRNLVTVRVTVMVKNRVSKFLYVYVVVAREECSRGTFISTTRFLFTTHVLHLWSLLLAHLPAPLWKSQIAPLGMLHLVYGMNSPLISASLVRHSLLHFLLSHMIMAFHHLHYHRLHLLLLAQYFILNSRLGSSANPFLHRPFSFLSGLITRTLGPSNDFTMLYGCTGKSTPSRFSNALLITTLSFIHSFHSFV